AIFDIGTWNKVPYLVMEHLKGESLAHVLERERLEPRRTVELMIDVARGLAHAHKQGIVHRDLKPSNVLVVEDGRAKILDFGLAVFSSASPGAPGGDGPPGPLSPASGGRSSVAGTPAYMAPEQWRGETQDERTDIWAAGVMLFRMFTGEPPYPLADVQKLCLAVASDDPAPSVLSRSED